MYMTTQRGSNFPFPWISNKFPFLHQKFPKIKKAEKAISNHPETFV